MDSNLCLCQPPPDSPACPDKVALPYHLLVGSLMYLAVGTCPDISYSVSKLIQFLNCHHKIHWDAAVHVVCYLNGTQTLSLILGGNLGIELARFSDSSYANCLDTRQSYMEYCFSLSRAVFSWSSWKQKTVACSTCDAKYITVSESCYEAVLLCLFLNKLGLLCPDSILLNNGALSLAYDLSHHA
jgi:hypothetical protein